MQIKRKRRVYNSGVKTNHTVENIIKQAIVYYVDMNLQSLPLLMTVTVDNKKYDIKSQVVEAYAKKNENKNNKIIFNLNLN